MVGELPTAAGIELDRLFKLRLVVARIGEMDNSKWWNTKGQLGALGSTVLTRGFPRTHSFAQARSVFAVAAQRCSEIFDPPDAVTLWKLPARIEDAFEEQWHQWLDHGDDWSSFFACVEAIQGSDLLGSLRQLGLVTSEDVDAVGKLKRAAEGRAVPLNRHFEADDATITLLAAAFARGEPQQPAVPYARLEA